MENNNKVQMQQLTTVSIDDNINPTSLANLFLQSKEFELSIYNEIQIALNAIEVSNSIDGLRLTNLDQIRPLLVEYSDYLQQIEEIQQNVTKKYFSLDENNKKSFMSELLNCNDDHVDIKLFDDMLSKISYTKMNTHDVVTRGDNFAITFEADLLKLITTQHGREQINNLNATLNNLKPNKCSKLDIMFRKTRDSMTYSPHGTDEVANENELKALETQARNDLGNYLNLIQNEDENKIISTKFSLDKVESHTLYGLFPDSRNKLIIKVGNNNGHSCLCISPKVASLFHELTHMQRALSGNSYSHIEKLLPKYFKNVYSSLEEFYTIQNEGKILHEFNIPARVTHSGGLVIDTKVLNDPKQSKTISQDCIRILCMGDTVLGGIPNIFNDIDEHIISTCFNSIALPNLVVDPIDFIANQALITTIHNAVKQRIDINIIPNIMQDIFANVPTNFDCDSFLKIYIRALKAIELGDVTPNNFKSIINEKAIKQIKDNFTTKAIIPILKQHLGTQLTDDDLNIVAYAIGQELIKSIQNYIRVKVEAPDIKDNCILLANLINTEYYTYLYNTYENHKPKVSQTNNIQGNIEDLGWKSSNNTEKFTTLTQLNDEQTNLNNTNTVNQDLPPQIPSHQDISIQNNSQDQSISLRMSQVVKKEKLPTSDDQKSITPPSPRQGGSN